MIVKLTDPAEVDRAVSEQRKRLRNRALPEAWADVGEVFADQYIRVVRDAVRFPSGQTGTYIKIELVTGEAGGVIAVPRIRDRFVLVRHSRYATGKVHLEFPRGFAESGESAEQAVVRELKEEIGASALSVSHIGTTYGDTGLLNFPIQVYAVTSQGHHGMEIEEGIEKVEFLSGDDIFEKIASGEIDDALTLAAFAMERAWTIRTAGVRSR